MSSHKHTQLSVGNLGSISLEIYLRDEKAFQQCMIELDPEELDLIATHLTAWASDYANKAATARALEAARARTSRKRHQHQHRLNELVAEAGRQVAATYISCVKCSCWDARGEVGQTCEVCGEGKLALDEKMMEKRFGPALHEPPPEGL